MTPLPWSFSSLSTFKTCPRKYYGEYILKLGKDEPQTEVQLYGIRVHKAFEERQRDDLQLPVDLRVHEGYMKKLDEVPGKVLVERKVALNLKLEPTGFFAPDVWWRGVIDFQKRGEKHSRIVDYKTGKMKSELLQLKLFGLFAFLEGAETVEAEFYWTQTQATTPWRADRSQIPVILKEIMPDLAQYKRAFNDDLWPPRKNGLCRKYCPVKDCEFNGI